MTAPPPGPGVVRRMLDLLGVPGTGPQTSIDGRDDRQVGRAFTVGEPILPSPEADALGVTSWTTQPRVCADGGSLGPLTVRAASAVGRRHARVGTSREDAYAITPAAGGVVVAVADGVGSADARFSAVGAQLAVVEACRLVSAALDNRWRIVADDLCRQIGTAMMDGAGRFVPEEFDHRSLSTTLTVAWVSTGGAFGGFRVGDGELFTLTAAGLQPAGPGGSGDFTETAALPGSWSVAEEFSGRLQPGSALVVVTDGLSVPMRSPEVADHFTHRWRDAPTVVEFLHDISFDRRGEADDRTAVCVWFRTEDGDR
ncbi:protein phosphatase 2C domain-containing protein [Actinoplanes sp. CA-252034]|uniref:protein phosphatase 2C domain-containing protein n=1 Tax=Actinoplanes sp. CA-252034 TaxID=3239906 RepID=UPI003D975EE1